jgi:hypothetical protein
VKWNICLKNPAGSRKLSKDGSLKFSREVVGAEQKKKNQAAGKEVNESILVMQTLYLLPYPFWKKVRSIIERRPVNVNWPCKCTQTR